MKESKTIDFATTNAGKAEEAKAILAKYGIKLVQQAVEVDEPKTLDLNETATRKAQAAFMMLGRPVIVEDTGLFFDAYPGFPGTYTKFAAKTIGQSGLLKMLDGCPRGAAFTTIAAFTDGKRTVLFEGTIQGQVARTPRGVARPGLSYDPIFAPEGAGGKTYAEIGTDEKNALSHRAVAFGKLGKWLKEEWRQ